MLIRLVVISIALAACGNGSSPSDGGDDGGSCSGYVVADSAKQGCRSPNDPGCATCCVPSANHCLVATSNGGSDGYNLNSVTPVCPADCAPCASCSDKTEVDLCMLLAAPLPQCDCANVNLGGDPCGTPESCECYCSQLEGAEAACPSQ